MKDLARNSFCNFLSDSRMGSGSNKVFRDVVMVAAFVVFFGVAAGFPADSPSFRGNPQHTGVYDAAGVPTLNGVKWAFKTEGQIIASPAVHGDTVYVGSTAGTLYAIDRATGSSKWQYPVKSRITSSPAVAGGLIYFGAFDGNFYAVSETTGQLKWKFQTRGEHRFSAAHLHGLVPENETMPDPWDCYLSSPVVWNGAVYFGSGDGNVYALDAATGTQKWKFKTGNVVHASPAIADGVVFVGSWDSYMYALDAATGAEKWRFHTGEDPVNHNQQGIQSSAAVSDSVVYFGCRDGHLYAVDQQSGVMKWSYNTKGSWVLNSPAVSHGKVYFATSDTGLLYAADAKTGAIAFSVNWGWPMYSSPAIAGDMLYIGSTAGTLNAARLSDGTKSWSFATEASKKNAAAIPSYFAPFTTNFYDDVMGSYDKLLTLGPILSSPVVVDNVIYVGSVDGNLYALD
jgi:outer membrane protein assembly factor BamB